MNFSQQMRQIAMKLSWRLKRLFMKYSWQLRLAAPRFFPVCADWFYVKYDKNSAVTNGTVFCACGLGEDQHQGFAEIRHCPTGVDLVWASVMERKWYTGDFEFSEEEMALIDSLFRNGFVGYDYNFIKNPKPQQLTYEMFSVCCLPGGAVRFYMIGRCKTICLDIVFHAEETHEMDDVIIHGPSVNRHPDINFYDSVSDYFDDNLYEGKHAKTLEELKEEENDMYEAIAYHRANGVPYGLWNRYFRRYNYKINVVFEDKETKLYHEDCKFANGERFMLYTAINPSNTIDRPSPVKELYIQWISKEYYYDARFYFNEEETLNRFENLLSESGNYTLEIRISKYNNYFEIVLKDDKDLYTFESVEIVAFRSVGYYGTNEKVYSNCDYDHQNSFIGS